MKKPRLRTAAIAAAMIAVAASAVAASAQSYSRGVGGGVRIEETYPTAEAARAAALRRAQTVAREFGSLMRIAIFCPRGAAGDDIMFLSALSPVRDSISVRIERAGERWRVRSINERDVHASGACRGEMIGVGG